MTKRFCDLCGESAAESLDARHVHPFGERYSSTVPNTLYIDDNTRAKIEVRARFMLISHPSRGTDDVDLCAKCANELLAKLKVGG